MNKEIGNTYIEGTDFTGKDSVSKVIAGVYGITNIHKLSLHYNNPWDADRTRELVPGHPLFPAYLLRSVIWDIQHFEPSKDKPRLQISFTASRSAAWSMTSKNGLGDVFLELLKYTPLFENSFLLTASIEVKKERALKRMAEKGKISDIDNLVFTKPDFVNAIDLILAEIVRKQMGAVVIDTDHRDIQSTVNILTAYINGDCVKIRDPNERTIQLDITPELARFHKEVVDYTTIIVQKKGIPEKEAEKVIKSFDST